MSKTKIMQRFSLLIVVTAIAFGPDPTASEYGSKSAFLVQVGTIPLKGVEGRLDHFGFDARRKRLFLAALGNDTVELVDLRLGKVIQQIKNLRAPQGIGVASEVDRLAVANDQDGSVRLYDVNSLQQTAAIELKEDADNVRYDPHFHRFWIGYGKGGLAAIDPEKGIEIANVRLESHPESFQLEAKGKRVFVNLPDSNYVGVVDQRAGKLVNRFILKDDRANFPMALDEAERRLFIGCRKPAALVVLDTETGKVIASVDIVGDADDLFYDALNKRIYVSGGEGKISVIQERSPYIYETVAEIPTAPGARTSFFVPETQTLYLAVPRRRAQRAEIRIFRVLR